MLTTLSSTVRIGNIVVLVHEKVYEIFKYKIKVVSRGEDNYGE